jgi:hypothetical protein
MSAQPPLQPLPPDPSGTLAPAKKSGALKWILIGVGGFLLLCVVGILLLGIFVVNKAKQAVSFEDAKQGKIVLKENGKDTVTFSASGDRGTLEVKSAEGSVKFGGAAKIPAWVPDYPGSEPQGAFSAAQKDGEAGSFVFKTKDDSGKVIKYYQDQFQSLGLKLNSNLTSQNGAATAGMLVAQDESSKHTITVIVGVDSGETTVSVSYATNK